jgi:hypothetical protein
VHIFTFVSTDLNAFVKVKISSIRLRSTLKQAVFQIRTTDPEPAAVCNTVDSTVYRWLQCMHVKKPYIPLQLMFTIFTVRVTVITIPRMFTGKNALWHGLIRCNTCLAKSVVDLDQNNLIIFFTPIPMQISHC